MKPVKFPGSNTVFGATQPEYNGLPAYYDKDSHDGFVVTCWRLNIWERVAVLFTGRLWLHVLTFNKPLQPLYMDVSKPILPIANKEAGTDE